MLAQLELSRHDIGAKEFYYGKGCDTCNNTGYKGRKGIYELMKITDPIRELINERRTGRYPETKGDRARHGYAASGWITQHFRWRYDHRGSAEVHVGIGIE